MSNNSESTKTISLNNLDRFWDNANEKIGKTSKDIFVTNPDPGSIGALMSPFKTKTNDKDVIKKGMSLDDWLEALYYKETITTPTNPTVTTAAWNNTEFYDSAPNIVDDTESGIGKLNGNSTKYTSGSSFKTTAISKFSEDPLENRIECTLQKIQYKYEDNGTTYTATLYDDNDNVSANSFKLRNNTYVPGTTYYGYFNVNVINTTPLAEPFKVNFTPFYRQTNGINIIGGNSFYYNTLNTDVDADANEYAFIENSPFTLITKGNNDGYKDLFDNIKFDGFCKFSDYSQNDTYKNKYISNANKEFLDANTKMLFAFNSASETAGNYNFNTYFTNGEYNKNLKPNNTTTNLGFAYALGSDIELTKENNKITGYTECGTNWKYIDDIGNTSNTNNIKFNSTFAGTAITNKLPLFASRCTCKEFNTTTTTNLDNNGIISGNNYRYNYKLAQSPISVYCDLAKFDTKDAELQKAVISTDERLNNLYVMHSEDGGNNATTYKEARSEYVKVLKGDTIEGDVAKDNANGVISSYDKVTGKCKYTKSISNASTPLNATGYGGTTSNITLLSGVQTEVINEVYCAKYQDLNENGKDRYTVTDGSSTYYARCRDAIYFYPTDLSSTNIDDAKLEFTNIMNNGSEALLTDLTTCKIDTPSDASIVDRTTMIEYSSGNDIFSDNKKIIKLNTITNQDDGQTFDTFTTDTMVKSLKNDMYTTDEDVDGNGKQRIFGVSTKTFSKPAYDSSYNDSAITLKRGESYIIVVPLNQTIGADGKLIEEYIPMFDLIYGRLEALANKQYTVQTNTIMFKVVPEYIEGLGPDVKGNIDDFNIAGSGFTKTPNEFIKPFNDDIFIDNGDDFYSGYDKNNMFRAHPRIFEYNVTNNNKIEKRKFIVFGYRNNSGGDQRIVSIYGYKRQHNMDLYTTLNNFKDSVGNPWEIDGEKVERTISIYDTEKIEPVEYFITARNN